MQLHTIKSTRYATKKPIRRVRGPGGKRGRTAGRGQKGQLARNRPPRGFEGGQTPLRRRLPRRGFTNVFKTLYWVVNLGTVSGCERLGEETEITPLKLIAAGLVRNERRPVKILGEGECPKNIKIHAHRFSRSAVEKIEAAGGGVQILTKKHTPKK